MAQERGETHPRGGDPFDGDKGGLGLGQSLGEVGGSGHRGGKPVSQPPDLALGLKTEPSKWIGALDMGPLSLFVRQWISSVLGIEKLMPSLAPLHFSLAYFLCRIWIFRR